MAEIRLKNISKSYGDVVALDNVSMTIPDGAFVVLLGPTGAGKTLAGFLLLQRRMACHSPRL